MISSGADLNDFTRSGFYKSGAGSLTATIVHRPTSVQYGFMLWVWADNHIQMLIETVQGVENVYFRGWDNGWGKWRRIAGTEVEYAQ